MSITFTPLKAEEIPTGKAPSALAGECASTIAEFVKADIPGARIVVSNGYTRRGLLIGLGKAIKAGGFESIAVRKDPKDENAVLIVRK